jgi:hypothetical protein
VAVAGQKENVVPAVGTGTVMEDALEPSLWASNSVVATPEKAWSQRQKKRSVVNLFYFFIGICGLTNLCFPMIPMTVSFFTAKAKGISNAMYGVSIIVFSSFSNLDLVMLMH